MGGGGPNHLIKLSLTILFIVKFKNKIIEKRQNDTIPLWIMSTNGSLCLLSYKDPLLGDRDRQTNRQLDKLMDTDIRHTDKLIDR